MRCVIRGLAAVTGGLEDLVEGEKKELILSVSQIGKSPQIGKSLLIGKNLEHRSVKRPMELLCFA